MVKDSDIAERMRTVSDKYSQAEIARRTGTPVANVNRYLRGSRVPASFCAALAKEFSVNPAWLLLGEGMPWLSDISAGNARLAGDLLEVLEAMNAVSSMRIGAFAGAKGLQELRKLDDTIRTYHRMRKKLASFTDEVGKSIHTALQKANNDYNVESGIGLVRAAEQLLPLTDGRLLGEQIRMEVGQHELLRGRASRSLNIQRGLFYSQFGRADEFGEQQLGYAAGMSGRLRQAGRHLEALRVLRSAAILAGTSLSNTETWIQVQFEIGALWMMNGYLNHAHRYLHEYFPKIDKSGQTRLSGYVARAYMLGGILTVPGAIATFPPDIGLAQHLARHALWTESKIDIDYVLTHCVGTSGNKLGEDLAESVMLKALVRRTALNEAFKKLDSARSLVSGPQSMAEHHLATRKAMLALNVDDSRLARRLIAQAEKARLNWPAGCRMGTPTEAYHWRNVLRCEGVDDKLKARAAKFFTRSIKRGFVLFAETVDPATASQP